MNSGNPFRRIFNGDVWQPSAELVNTLMVVAEKEAGTRANPMPPQEELPRETVLVLNSSGSALPILGVVGIGGIQLGAPNGSAPYFTNPLLIADTPATGHVGKFAIVARPMDDGEIGRAFMTGICPVKINITSAAHSFADIKSGDSTQLQSGTTGGARILWAESGTGSKWALVNLCGDAGIFRGTITGSTGTAWGGTGATYTAVLEYFGTVTATNSLEPGEGVTPPGPLGVRIDASDGTVNGTSCVERTLGEGAITMFWRHPTIAGQFEFCLVNSAD